MRIGIFTGVLIVVLTALLVCGELILKENRTTIRAYSAFSDAVEYALDDACEYLGVMKGEGMKLTESGAGYLESVFIEALAAALGRDSAATKDTLEGMTVVFAVSDGKGQILLRNTRLGGKWKKAENCSDQDEAAKVISRSVLEGLGVKEGEDSIVFLPGNTGLTGVKAAENPYVLAYMTCRIGTGIGGVKDFVCVRNAQIKTV